MKKIYDYTRLMLIALISVTALSSCDEDSEIAYDLDGAWSGTVVGDYYYYRYGKEYVAYEDWDTYIEFYQNGSFATSGEGYEYDENRRTGQWSETYFDWQVRNGKIYIYYDDGSDVVIRDYEVYQTRGVMRFRGYFDDLRGNQLASFDFVKVAGNHTRAAENKPEELRIEAVKR